MRTKPVPFILICSVQLSPCSTWIRPGPTSQDKTSAELRKGESSTETYAPKWMSWLKKASPLQLHGQSGSLSIELCLLQDKDVLWSTELVFWQTRCLFSRVCTSELWLFQFTQVHERTLPGSSLGHSSLKKSHQGLIHLGAIQNVNVMHSLYWPGQPPSEEYQRSVTQTRCLMEGVASPHLGGPPSLLQQNH